MNDTRQQFITVMDAIGLPVDHLTSILSAIERSIGAIDRARSLLAEDSYLSQQKLDFIGFGSLARHEMTESSDLDYLLVGDPADEPNTLQEAAQPSVARLREGMVDDVVLSGPGKTGLFGSFVSSTDIINTIGLEADTNHTLTRRILLLEESVSLFDPESHELLLRRILSEYLGLRKPGSSKVPRVLLNDIIRYWRTIAVDYHAKSSPEEPYSLRYLKLLIPRKICYVASIAPLYLMSFNEGNTDEVEFLVNQFSQPAMVRLGRLLAKIVETQPDDTEIVRTSAERIFQTLNYFIERSGNMSWRDKIVEECKEPDPRSSEAFGYMRELGQKLHSDVGAIFTSEVMLPFTKEYMIS